MTPTPTPNRARLRGRGFLRAVRAVRWPRGQAADTVLAVAVMAVTLAMTAFAEKPGDRALWPGGVVLIVGSTLALAARRRHPVAVLVVSVAVPPLYYPMGYPDGPVGLVLWVALLTAAVECRLVVSLGAVIVVNAGFLGASLLQGGGGSDPDAIVGARGVASLSIGLLVTVGLGQYVRSRRDRAEAAERRAAEAERSREAEARRRAIAERLRIARELHDVLAHQISLINVQAGAALHRRDDPDRAYAALEAIKSASKETLRELRGVLGVLRHVDAGGGGADGGGRAGDGGPVAPQPSLAQVDDLLEQTAAAGLNVRRAGDLAASPASAPGGGVGGVAEEAAEPPALAELPAPVGLAGYRIVQEALTNAVRHSGAAEVTVMVRRVPGAVIVQVDDDGTGGIGPRGAAGRSGPAGGHGLRGMRERAASVGGRVSAGPGPVGGFRVWARLPLGDGPGEEQERMEEIT